jgi:hypothetical protein
VRAVRLPSATTETVPPGSVNVPKNSTLGNVVMTPTKSARPTVLRPRISVALPAITSPAENGSASDACGALSTTSRGSAATSISLRRVTFACARGGSHDQGDGGHGCACDPVAHAELLSIDLRIAADCGPSSAVQVNL